MNRRQARGRYRRGLAILSDASRHIWFTGEHDENSLLVDPSSCDAVRMLDAAEDRVLWALAEKEGDA